MMEKKKFEYTYTAPTEQERREIESIRRQYMLGGAAPEGGIERLRYLDDRVKRGPTCWGLVLGVLGLLIFGLGLSMVLQWALYLWGVLVAVVGAIPMGMAYPVYCRVLRRNKDKYGAEILHLTEALLEQSK
jgi:hypothetical protein